MFRAPAVPSVDLAPVGVALITHQRPESVAHTLHSLLAQTLVPETIVILDNGIGARAFDSAMFRAQVAWASRFGVQIDYLVRLSRGMVGARIEAEAAVAKYPVEFVLAADDDVAFSPRYVEQAVQRLSRQPTVHAVGGGLICSQIDQGRSQPWHMETGSMLMLSGGTIMYKRELVGIVNSVGRYTDCLGEDLIWQHLVERAGFAIAPATEDPAVQIQHHMTVDLDHKYDGEVLSICRREFGREFPSLVRG